MSGTIEHSWNGTILTIKSDSGVSSCDLKGAQGDMGVRGPQGIPGIVVSGGDSGGSGENGATFTPYVSTDGVISWTNDKGLENPAPVNIKGAKGEKGAQGIQGEKGADGTNGKDGTSVTVSKVTTSTADGGSNVVTFSDGKTLTVKNGTQGSAGMDGEDGADGITPVKGVDYWTSEDKAEITAEANTLISTELAKKQQLKPEFANDIDECIDTTKLYVLPDNYIWAYMRTPVIANENVFDPSSSNVKINKRLGNATYEYLNQNGQVTTDYIPYDISRLSALNSADKFFIRIKGCSGGANIFSPGANTFVSYYSDDISATFASKIGNNYINIDGSVRYPITTEENGDVLVDLRNATKFSTTADTPNFDTVKYVRFTFAPNANTTAITTNDIANIEIYVEGYKTVSYDYAWANTGRAFVPADYEDRIIPLENEVIDHELRIMDLENSTSSGGTSAIPSYWEEAINEAEAKIKAFQEEGGADCVSFVWASDTHCLPNQSASGQYATARNVGRLAGKLMNDLNIPFFAVTGDLSADSGSADTFPDKTDIDEFFDKIVAPVGKERVLLTLGNHDGTTYSTSGDRNISKATRFNWFMRPFCNDNKRIWGGGEYYYKDDTQGRIRFIALCANNGSTNIYRVQHYEGAQLKWLAEEALDTPNGYTVVVLSHFPSNGKEPASTIPENSDVLMAILTAFDNKTNYSGSADGVVISANYSNSNSVMCGVFAGHIHEDTIDTSKGFPIITIDTAGNKTSIVDRTFTNGSDKETAFDVVSINKASRTIYMTRLGAGSNREIDY